MSGEAIAVIIAATIAAIGTIVATRFNEIVDLLRTPSRHIEGSWVGESYMLDRGTINDSDYEQPRPPDMKYTATLNQAGSRVKGTMVMTEAQIGIGLYQHVYKGNIKGSYFIYDLFTTKPEQFRLSAAMLHIHNSGRLMRGYFVANSGDKDARQTVVGYTVMRKKD